HCQSGRALLDVEGHWLGFHQRLNGKASNDFVLTGRNGIDVVVTVVPDDFKRQVSTRTQRFLSDHLRKQHTSRPAPHFLPCGFINDCEVVSLAGFETEWYQLLGRIDDRQHELRPTRHIRNLNVESDRIVRRLSDILNQSFRLLLRSLRLWKRGRSLCSGL